MFAPGVTVLPRCNPSHLNRPCCCTRLSHLLVGFLALGASGARAAVVSLDDEGVLLLQLAVHEATGPELTLARRTVQHHRLEGGLQPVDVERTDLPWRPGRQKRKEGGRGQRRGRGRRSVLITQSEGVFRTVEGI